MKLLLCFVLLAAAVENGLEVSLNQQHERGPPGCTICRPPQDLQAPCGPAYNEWLAFGGFYQWTGTCIAVATPTTFCGSQPVRSSALFAGTNLNVNASFSTADGSCTCNYCYSLQNFDLSSSLGPYGGGVLPRCWDAGNTGGVGVSLPAGIQGWNVSTRFFQSAPQSVGLDLTGPWPGVGAPPTALSVYALQTVAQRVIKNRLTFWLKVVNLNATAGEFVSLAWFSPLGTQFPASSILRCPYNYNNQGWSGNFECTVEVDLLGVTSVQFYPVVFRWFVTFEAQPKTIVTTSKRVAPPVTTTTYPVSGVWIDDVNFCGDTLPLPLGP